MSNATNIAVDARSTIAQAKADWDGGTIEDAVKERYNCRVAQVVGTGDVWIADPQRGHWLSDEEILALVDWMRGMSYIE